MRLQDPRASILRDLETELAKIRYQVCLLRRQKEARPAWWRCGGEPDADARTIHSPQWARLLWSSCLEYWMGSIQILSEIVKNKYRGKGSRPVTAEVNKLRNTIWRNSFSVPGARSNFSVIKHACGGVELTWWANQLVLLYLEVWTLLQCLLHEQGNYSSDALITHLLYVLPSWIEWVTNYHLSDELITCLLYV